MKFYKDKVGLDLTVRNMVKEEDIKEVTVITWYKMKNFDNLRFRVRIHICF